MAIDLVRLLAFSRDLQRAASLRELLDATARMVEEVAGYRTAWIAAFEPGPPRMVRILATGGDREPLILAKAPLFPFDGDPMLAEIASARGPVMVADATTDPRTNKEIVARLGNRTIVNVPLVLGAELVGAIGTGSFGDEGVRVPSPEALEQLTLNAALVAAAFDRLKLLEQQRQGDEERKALERRLQSVRRIESLALLAGGVAHDFNNLLTVILNALRFAAAGPLQDEQRQDLADALDAAEKGRALTHQLLAMGRQQALALQPLAFDEVVASAVRLLRRLLPATIAVDAIVGRSLPSVLGDPGQLEQALLNLCLNARDAMPDGGRLTLEVEQVVIDGEFIAAHPWAKPGRSLLVSISDTGTGMTPEVADRIFEPFFTTKAPGLGTGLGLATTRGIIEQHGGMLHCYSEPGVGTTFKVYLPAHDRPASSVGRRVEGKVPTGSERILVADDDAAVLSVARRILERAGYRVTAVGDGRDAIARAQAEPFDLVLLDVIMPGATGREVWEALQARGARCGFVFASGYAANVLPAEFLHEAGVELLEKPYHPDQLLRAVRRALDRDR